MSIPKGQKTLEQQFQDYFIEKGSKVLKGSTFG